MTTSSSYWGGKPTPAVGFATGIERIILNLQKQDIKLPQTAPTKVYVACLGEEAREPALKLAARLHQAGIGVTLAMDDRSLKAQLRQANALGLSQAIIIGEEEVRTGSVILRDMAKGEQIQLPLEKAILQLTDAA